MSPQERIDVVQAFSGLYAGKLAEMADLITLEMGSPTSFANLAQSPAPWMQIEAFLGIAREFPWEAERAGVLGSPVVVRREPVGVVAAIPPWNVPQFTIMSKLVPALLAGCTIVVKPAPETPLDGYLLAELLTEAGVPNGVVNIVAAGREVGEHLVAHPGVDKVAFTGSTAAGRKIAAVCGEQLKRVSLELGGKSAAIVLDDADLTATMAGLRFTALMNSGQACVAQTRILASRANYDAVVDALVETVASMPVGDPMDPATEIGPLVAQRQQERVEKYIALGQEEGARVALGGNGMPDGLVLGLVRPADRLRRRRQRDADRAGGDLRAGPLGDPLRRRRRRGPDRQRLRLRPGRHRVDHRQGGRARRGPPGARRDLRREHVHDGLRGAVRRLQVLGHRPRVRARGAGAVHRAQVDLHRTAGDVTEHGTEQLDELAYYAVTHHPADARKVFAEATDAEGMGLGSCMISERFTVKEAGALAGAVAGRAPSLGIASAAINHHTRHPVITAAMGSTLKAITEGKYAMSFGRGSSEHWKTLGLPVVTEAMLRDFLGLLRQLWTDGFVLDHDGPAGKFPVLHNLHGLEGGGPPLGLVAVGPRTMALAGELCDFVIMHTFFSEQATTSTRSRRSAAAPSARAATPTRSASGRAWPPYPTASRRTTTSAAASAGW